MEKSLENPQENDSLKRKPQLDDEEDYSSKKSKVSLVTAAEESVDCSVTLNPELPETVTTEESIPGNSMSFRLKILNLSKYFGTKFIEKELKKSLIINGQSISFKCRKAPTWDYAFLSFTSADDLQNARPLLTSLILKGKVLEVQDAPLQLRDQRNDNRNKSKDSMISKIDSTKTPDILLADQVTPLWNVPYPKQLSSQQVKLRKTIKNWKKSLHEFLKGNILSPFQKSCVEWVRGVDEGYEADIDPDSEEVGTKFISDGLLCPLSKVVPSPVLNDYRNKCEFTCGRNLDGEKTVGFLLGLYKEGVTSVLDPKDTLNVSATAKKIASLFQEFIRTKSTLDIYDRIKKQGFWRLLVTRTYNTGDSMAIVQICPTDLPRETIQSELDTMVKFFSEQEINGHALLKTLLVQEHAGHHNGFIENQPTTTLTGDGYVYEELLGIRFRISPTAFFQINTAATELLYTAVRDWALKPKTEKPEEEKGVVLLDLCCGTGTIGISMAPHVKKVIGVDIVETAIEDAKVNAEANGITNAIFIASKVEDVMSSIFKEHVGVNDRVVVVLDPPRSGVHSSVIRTIRHHEGVERIVYVACDADNAMQNLIDLTRPPTNRIPGPLFKPVRALPFDLFPHTNHTELIIEFVRDYSTRPPTKEKASNLATMGSESEPIHTDETTIN
ncbi:tRNA methyltransferase 2 [Nowakowskiella sp. JEL0078]|nr:tRNA methyltransferase 2 [Nowakowskiella sp. JEL0078]